MQELARTSKYLKVNARDTRHMICSRSSINHKGYLRLRWGAHEGPGLSWPQTSSSDHKDQVRFFTIKSPQRRGQYKFFEAHHNIGSSQRTPSPSRRWISKSNKHTEIVGAVLFLEDQMAHSRFGSNLSLEAWILIGAWERVVELKNLGRKPFWNQWSEQLCERGVDPLL
jgi:hypothetical protein